MGLGLMDWLRERCLPEEARLSDPAYAGFVADEHQERHDWWMTALGEVCRKDRNNMMRAYYQWIDSLGLENHDPKRPRPSSAESNKRY